MARKFLVPIGLVSLSSDPAGTSAGQTYYNTTLNKIRIYTGTVWADAGTSAQDVSDAIAGSALASTDDLTEGAQNLYYTNERVGDYITTNNISLQGTTGAQGAQGTQGIQGLIGTQGIVSGASAPATQGILWLDTTAAAETGPQGTTGAQGITGAQGTAGSTGAQGTIGATGSQGATGVQGALGSTGAQGTTGAQGVEGTQGISGAEVPAATPTAQGVVYAQTDETNTLLGLNSSATREGTLATNATGVGEDALASGNASTALGNGAWARGANSTALGRYTQVDHNASIALGVDANTNGANQISIGGSVESGNQITRFRVRGMGIDWTSNPVPAVNTAGPELFASTAFSAASDEIYYQSGILYIGVGGAPDAAVFNNAYPVGSVVTISEYGVANTVFTVTSAASYNGIEIELPATLTSGSGNYGSNWVITGTVPTESGKYLTNDGTVSSWDAINEVPFVGATTLVSNTAFTSVPQETNYNVSTGRVRFQTLGSGSFQESDRALLESSFPIGTAVTLSGTISGSSVSFEFIVISGVTNDANDTLRFDVTPTDDATGFHYFTSAATLTSTTSGKYLTNDGTTSSWGTVASYSAPTLGSTAIASGATVTTISGLTDIVLNGAGSVQDELTLILMGAL